MNGWFLSRSLTLLLVLSFSAACVHNPPILVGQSALAAADSIGKLSTAAKQLEQAAVLPPAAALNFQRALLAVNDKLLPLPDILRTIDRLQKAGSSSASETDRAIAILTVAGQDISVVVAGVPVSDATKALIDLIRAAEQTIQSVLVEVAKIRGRQS